MREPKYSKDKDVKNTSTKSQILEFLDGDKILKEVAQEYKVPEEVLPLVLESVSEKNPQMVEGFIELSRREFAVFLLKNYNYGSDNMTDGGDVENAEVRKLSLMGLYFRMRDKINRIKQLTVLNKEDVVGEKLSETLMDLGNYGKIGILIQNRKWGK